MEPIEKIPAHLYRVQPISCTACRALREVVPDCPILVLPDDLPAHPLQFIDIASLAPTLISRCFPWKYPPGLKAPPSTWRATS